MNRFSKKIVAETLQRIRAAGRAPGILATDPNLANYYQDCGALFVAIGVDTVLLANSTASLASSFNGQQAPANPHSNGAY